MKKEDFNKYIDSIVPDAYMGNRLYAKVINGADKKRKKPRALKVVACFGAVVLFVSAICSYGMFYGNSGDVQTEQTTQGTAAAFSKPFVIVASAADYKSGLDVTQDRTMEINEKYPFGVYLKVVSTKALTQEQREAVLRQINDNLFAYCGSNEFSLARSCVVTADDFYLVECVRNEFRLTPTSNNIKSVNVKNSSPYGEIVYATNKPQFSPPVSGNNITVNGDEFDFAASGFYWSHTEEMKKMLAENINIPFSAFNDIITFTVEYNDGSKAVNVVELIFDSNGNAATVCKKSEFVKAGDK